MATCGEPNPNRTGVTCIADHSTENPPQAHASSDGSSWPNAATRAWLAEKAKQRSTGGARGRKAIMAEAARMAKPDDRVGPYKFPTAGRGIPLPAGPRRSMG